MNNLILVNEIRPDITSVALNRQEKRNALNIPLLKELLKALQEVKTRVLFLMAEGPVFSSGLDLAEATIRENIEESAKLLNQVYQILYQMPSITFSIAQGSAYAGGLGLVSACDFAIAEKSAKFGFPEVRRGLVPYQVMALLEKKVSSLYLRQLFLLGEAIDANKAQEIGLIFEAVEKKNLLPKAFDLADQILKGAPKSIKETKSLILNSEGSLSQSLQDSLLSHLKMRQSAEAMEGFKAFLEKREPVW